ncbi:MAG: hypothetical protein M3530_08970 [Thermoproteota archaeon]|nr:hypothetical protein [Thermoproteota archaeon]
MGSKQFPPSDRTTLFETRYNSLSVFDNIYLDAASRVQTIHNSKRFVKQIKIGNPFLID